MTQRSSIAASDVIDSLNEGVYLCDLDRRITYWSESAERITGWPAKEVVGRQCFDNVLCHVDKDGHRLCGEEFCPLHRSIVTGETSREALLVFAQGKDGGRIPMHVSVAPLRNAEGRIVGGVETFRDASSVVHDLKRAKAIQQLALQHDLPVDPRITIRTHYVPHDIIGGDYYAIQPIDEARYGFMLADVMGHGIAAALYTMHLSQLWDRYAPALTRPEEFASTINRALVDVVKSDHSFATAVCGFIDLSEPSLCVAGAGGPPVVVMHDDGSHDLLEVPGLPLALADDIEYDRATASLRAGDSVLLFSDGAVEVMDSNRAMIGVDGLVDLLRRQQYPERPLRMDLLEEQILRFSNAIRLPDDLTLIEIRIGDV
ncbi:MAG: PP2C family protein-serine/threonine phosphatase [Planctomycetota bacterium]|jgi:PAS domain S-box-containing protein